MNIIFFGTPEFAVPSLQLLHKSGHHIKAVVTAPGKQAGRGLQIKEPPVKIAADTLNIKTLQPLKLSEPVFLDEIRSLNADLFIVVAFRMMPESLWKMPPLGTFNLHSSLLPQYRGAAPINRAIMNGETETGLTTFFLKHEIDTGDIIFREKILIGADELAGELHDRMKMEGAELVLKTVIAIENKTISEIPQSHFAEPGVNIKSAPKIFTEDCKIDWNQSSQDVHNLVRGLSPFPGAFSTLRDKNQNSLHLKIFKSALTGIKSSGPTGKIELQKDRLFIHCADNLLEILELQLEGKKRISASDFLKGFRAEKEYVAV